MTTQSDRESLGQKKRWQVLDGNMLYYGDTFVAITTNPRCAQVIADFANQQLDRELAALGPADLEDFKRNHHNPIVAQLNQTIKDLEARASGPAEKWEVKVIRGNPGAADWGEIHCGGKMIARLLLADARKVRNAHNQSINQLNYGEHKATY